MSKKLISYKIICISGNATIVSLSLKEPKVATTWRAGVNTNFVMFVVKSGQDLTIHATKTGQLNNMKDYLNKMDVAAVSIVANNHVDQHGHLFFNSQWDWF